MTLELKELPLFTKQKREEALELAKKCAKADRTAQKKVFELYASKMKAVCMRYAANADEAKDLMQEGFIKVFQNMDKFRGDASLETWVTRVMINNAITYLRKNNKITRQTIALDENFDHEDEELTEEEEEITSEEVIELMQQLPPGYRTILNLYAIENYSHKEIADQLEINEGTSRSQLLKARKMLKKMINERRK